MSKREQDIPTNSDERLEYRIKRLIDPKIIIILSDYTITYKANNIIPNLVILNQKKFLNETEKASISYKDPLTEL